MVSTFIAAELIGAKFDGTVSPWNLKEKINILTYSFLIIENTDMYNYNFLQKCKTKIYIRNLENENKDFGTLYGKFLTLKTY